VLSLGSILHEAKSGDVVWGSGAIRDEYLELSNVRILALRGPRTLKIAKEPSGVALGDPAILMPHIYRPVEIDRMEIGIIPHYVDKLPDGNLGRNVRLIDVTELDWRRTIDQIASCDIILSSSLHGLIVAEAYGIPSVWVRLSNRVVGQGFKFLDYYESTGREGINPVDWSLGIVRAASLAKPPPQLDGEQLLASWPEEWRKN
jgi:pyruvyltransferase